MKNDFLFQKYILKDSDLLLSPLFLKKIFIFFI